MALDGRRSPQGGVADPASSVEQAVENTNFTYGLVRAFVCDIGGAVNFIDGGGNAITGYPSQQGYNPVKVQQFTDLGPNTVIFGLY